MLRREMRVGPGSGRGALADPDALTDRERQILGLLVDGVTANRAIAAVLGISENTVKFHLRNILTKLQLADRAQVVGFALRRGLVER